MKTQKQKLNLEKLSISSFTTENKEIKKLEALRGGHTGKSCCWCPI